MIVPFLFILYSASADSAKEGDHCIKDGAAGMCTNIRECAAAQMDIENRISPQLCEFIGVDPIVCCVTPVTTTTARPHRGNCTLPPYPDYGTYVTNIPDSQPGDAFDIVLVNVTCNLGHEANGSRSVFCQNGWWPEPVPNCVPACRLLSNPSIEFHCIVSDGRVNGTRACKEFEPQGTAVSARCKENFFSPIESSFMTCVGGALDFVTKCKPECGRVTTDGTELTNGTPKRGEVPWHAGIYKKIARPYMHICGGTLISNNIIISAAHCFWPKFASNKSEYAVAVGKLYREWNNVDDMPWEQKSDLKEIHIPERFQGSVSNYQEDIAVLVVSTSFEYKAHVQPVCVDFDYNLERQQLQPGNKGKIAGWGLTGEEDRLSQVLKIKETPYVATDICIREMPPSFRYFISSDKICAGATDGSIAMCRGDTGSGLIFPETTNGVQRYYFRGIMSMGPTNEHLCSTKAYMIFTLISRQESFIKQFFSDSSVTNSPLCRGCMEAEETPRHVLMDCRSVADQRARILQSPSTLPETCGSLKRLLTFWNDLAAHCFWDSLVGKLPPSDFVVAVGKLYRDFDHKMEKAQFSNVEALRLPPRFRQSATNFQDDIAVVELSTPVQFQEHIRPVCVDFNARFEQRQLQPGNKGKVAGWGLITEDGKPSQELRVVDLPYVSIESCFEKVPLTFNAFITSDKICAGYDNAGTAVCKGDSGGGLAFLAIDKGTPRYYLRGIASTAPTNDFACNANTFTTFTRVIKHEDFITRHWRD